MAVEDELRGGAIPDIKPRILTDQVCACVYIFSHASSLKQSCPPNTLPHSCITSTASPPQSGQQCHALHLFPSFKSTTSMSQHFTIRFAPLKGKQASSFSFFLGRERKEVQFKPVGSQSGGSLREYQAVNAPAALIPPPPQNGVYYSTLL